MAWYDPTTWNNPLDWADKELGQAGRWLRKKLYGSPSSPSLPAPPVIPDLSELAIRLARERELRRRMTGGTNSTFLSGVLGDQGAPRTFTQQLIGS